jgi:uncharacterized protein (TIGR02145 family)
MKTKPYLITAVFLMFLSLLFTQQSCKKDDSTSGNSSGTFTDTRDGHTYKTISVGNNTWFAENLDYDTPGSYKPTEKSCSLEGNPGRYYLYETAKNACPTGWHLPTDDEWTDLELSVGLDYSTVDSLFHGPDVGKKLKSKSGWKGTGEVGGNGTDDIDFTVLPVGAVNSPSEGHFELHNVGESAYFWSSTKSEGITVYVRGFVYYRDESIRTNQMGNYHCVRCMK